MNQDVLDICSKLERNPQDIVINSYKSKKKLTYYQLVEALLLGGSGVKAASMLEVTYRSISRATPKLGLPSLNGGKESFRYKFLHLLNKKDCGKCNTTKSITDFHQDRSSSTGYKSECKDCSSEKFKKWYSENTEQHNLNTTLRKRSLDRQLSIEEVQFVFDRDDYKCQKCGLTNEEHLINHGQRLHLDHVVPVSKGGLTTVENSQLLCRSCNSSKNDKHV